MNTFQVSTEGLSNVHRLKRGDNGRFDDGDLATILQDATKNRAAAFGARGVPEVLRVIEIMGIEQERSWGTCSVSVARTVIFRLLLTIYFSA